MYPVSPGATHPLCAPSKIPCVAPMQDSSSAQQTQRHQLSALSTCSNVFDNLGCLNADQEQHKRDVAALHAEEGAFAQRETEQAAAAMAEKARRVEQGRELQRQRAELRDVERAVQAERLQAQQGEACQSTYC